MNTNEISVAGRNWSSANIFRTVHIEGKTIREILIDALCRFRGKKFDELSDAEIAIFLDRCRCKVDGVEIDSKDWSTYKPSAGSFVEFIIAPGKALICSIFGCCGNIQISSISHFHLILVLIKYC